MKRFLITGAPLAAACLLAAGCGTPGSYQQSHSTAGAIMGAGAGTIIGAAYGRPAEGALAGALIGGAAGAVAGAGSSCRLRTCCACQRPFRWNRSSM